MLILTQVNLNTYSIIPITLIIFNLLLTTKLTTACSCAKVNHRESFCSNNFVAIVTINSHLPCTDWYNCYDVTLVRRFKPITSNSNVNHDLIREIITANTSTACGQEFILNTQYLVMGSLLEGTSTSKIEVYSCSYPIEWSSLKYEERKNYLSEIKPNEPCRKKRKRVLSRTEFTK